jgi:3-deoxy-D-manno-octulosonate 8-phosphate phosphatase (KDO 8-P phosphatase)
MTNFKQSLAKIKAFAFDVDGVFSSSSAILHPSGEMLRTMNIKDGYALQYAVKKGYPVAIITGANSQAVATRFKNLGVKDIYLSSLSKRNDLTDFLNKYGLDASEVLYMGDDLPDIEALVMVGVPTCPCDAAEEIKNIAQYISDKKGGDGCVRDILEQVLKLQGKWMDGDHLSW